MARRILFTINNFTNDDLNILKEFEKHEKFRYICYQGEMGEEKLTPHLQGYLEVRENYDFPKWFKKHFHPTAHLAPAMGKSTANIHYCSKPVKDCKCKHCVKARRVPKHPQDFYEAGKPAVESQGDYFDTIKKMIQEGKSWIEIVDEYPQAMKHKNYIDDYTLEYKRAQTKTKFRRIRFIWLYGDTGVGKTGGVFTTFEHSDVYVATKTHPFDLYMGEPVVFFDDYQRMDIRLLLKYTDVYAYPLECRFHPRLPEYNDFIIASNETPHLLYSQESQKHQDALRRRVITVRVHLINKTRKYNYKGKNYDTLKECLDQIPYREF